MKVFISHSWKNKTKAQQIADGIAEMGIKVWMDATELLPGVHIQNTIDQALNEMDVVLLVWSNEAAASAGVGAEIETVLRLNKLILPCKLDDTKYPQNSPISAIKGIGFTDFQLGLGRLKLVLMNLISRDLENYSNAILPSLNAFIGNLEVADNLAHKQDFKNTGSEEDKDYWEQKILDSEKAARNQLTVMQEKLEKIQSFMAEKIALLEQDIHNPQLCAQVLEAIKNHPDAGEEPLLAFSKHVENMLKSFETQVPNDAVVKFKAELEVKLEEAHKLMKQTTGWLLGDLFEGSFQKMRYFYLQSAVHLQYLIDLAPKSHPAIGRVAADLLRYIQSPGGIVSNTDYGVLGYADDASLIHTLTLAMRAEGLTDAGLDATDWDAIDAGAETAFSLLGADVKTKLQKEIENYYNGLVQDYWPERIQQMQMAEIQKQRDDIWRAKLIGAQGDLDYIAGPYYP